MNLADIKKSTVCPICKKPKFVRSLRCDKCYRSHRNGNLSKVICGARRKRKIAWLKKLKK